MKIQILSFLLLFSCAFGYSQDVSLQTNTADHGNVLEENARGYYSQVFGYPIQLMKNADLYEIVSDWLGTPYCYSGKSVNGIDCSGFVSMLYDKAFNISISGNSSEISEKIAQVKKSDLNEGDLIFFKIRKRRISHVGVYLGENKFVHATTHNGVIISDLNEPYYKKYYSKGGKITNSF